MISSTFRTMTFFDVVIPPASCIVNQLVNSSIRGRTRHDLTEMQVATLIEQGYRGGIATTSPDPLYVPRNIAASQPVG